MNINGLINNYLLVVNMLFNSRQKLLGAAGRAAGRLVEKPERDLSFDTQSAFLVVDRLLYPQLRHRESIDRGDYLQVIPHLCGMLVMALDRDDGDGHPIFLTLLDRITELPHHVISGTLEITDVIRVMDDAHLVSLVVPDREICLRIYHNKNVTYLNKLVTLFGFQRIKILLKIFDLQKGISLFFAFHGHYFLGRMSREGLVGELFAHSLEESAKP